MAWLLFLSLLLLLLQQHWPRVCSVARVGARWHRGRVCRGPTLAGLVARA